MISGRSGRAKPSRHYVAALPALDLAQHLDEHGAVGGLAEMLRRQRADVIDGVIVAQQRADDGLLGLHGFFSPLILSGVTARNGA
jgi:hypothetical protein